MIFISVGTNLGNRLNNLWHAITLIKQRCLYDTKCSIILETEAILPEYAPYDWNKPFLNMLIGSKTHLSSTELLYNLKNIEREIGRPKHYEKWSPRIIDLDILLYNDLIVKTDDLSIPHPELKNRDFFQHLLALMQVKPWTCKQNIMGHFLKSYVLEPRLVGVINITKDSFSDGGKFYNFKKAVDQVISLDQEGASIIEIGAQSTRPKAKIQQTQTEYAVLDEILSKLISIITDRKLQISIDTFRPSIALELIKKYKISFINDVSGKFDDNSLRMIAERGCKFCFMHSLSIPPHKNSVIPVYIEPLEYLIEWGKTYIEKLIKLGFSLNDIILDPGIGFGKTPYQNIIILKNIKRLKSLGCQIMLGHSRKSYIQAFSKEMKANNRDIETIGVSLAIENKIDFLRVHNVKDHMKAMVAYHLFQKE